MVTFRCHWSLKLFKSCVDFQYFECLGVKGLRLIKKEEKDGKEREGNIHKMGAGHEGYWQITL